jgi:AcrR family transcriptional regulator
MPSCAQSLTLAAALTRKICTARYGNLKLTARTAYSGGIVASAKRKKGVGRKRAHAEVSDRRVLKGMVSRDRILDAALELFSQRGYAATGVYDIAKSAGIEKTALYWHFGSKEGLLAAVLDRMDAEFVERIAKRVARVADDSDARLDLFVNGVKKLVSSAPTWSG